MMPSSVQEELKRIYFRRQIKQGRFITPEPEYELLSSLVAKGDWAIDIGANIGHYPLKLSELVGEDGRVIAFEPVMTTFVHLSENMQLSRFDNITLINAAASEKTSLVSMTIPEFTTGLKNYYQANISEDSGRSDTSALTFSIDGLQIEHKISRIKIDAEGHEPSVMRGMLNILERDKPILIIETVTDQMQDKLSELGYEEEHLKNSPNKVFFEPVNNSV